MLVLLVVEVTCSWVRGQSGGRLWDQTDSAHGAEAMQYPTGTAPDMVIVLTTRTLKRGECRLLLADTDSHDTNTIRSRVITSGGCGHRRSVSTLLEKVHSEGTVNDNDIVMMMIITMIISTTRYFFGDMHP